MTRVFIAKDRWIRNTNVHASVAGILMRCEGDNRNSGM